jgi:hypothetical protein
VPYRCGSLRGRGHAVAAPIDLAVAGNRSAKSKAEPRSRPGVYKGSRSKGLEPVFLYPPLPATGRFSSAGNSATMVQRPITWNITRRAPPAEATGTRPPPRAER